MGPGDRYLVFGATVQISPFSLTFVVEERLIDMDHAGDIGVTKEMKKGVVKEKYYHCL